MAPRYPRALTHAATTRTVTVILGFPGERTGSWLVVAAGFVSSVAVRLNHVTLAVRDVESSARFYARLGLTQIVADYPHYARLLAPHGDTTLSLHPATDQASAPGASIHFEVDDVDRAVEGLKRAGFGFLCDPADQPYLWREAILLDPDGHRVFIYHAGKNRLDPPWRLPRETAETGETTTHHATVAWNGDKRDLRAHEIRLAGQALAGSCASEWGGDPEKADPEEMFVAAVSACHMLWFLDFARRERLRVISYEDRPEGTMDAHKFVAITLRPRAVFGVDTPTDVIEALHERAHQACFIANSVTCPVKVEVA
jgi:organic hydroperoxide reductase OsmC/OhrA/catechol 2,3-dioxygenase-like lactoylglutathione lyase family enzyme